MKQKEIHLDFTSLLDVVLIILFFFILFTTFDVSKNNEDYNKKTAELEQERQQLYEELENERQKLEDAKDSSYKNYQALQDFGEGKFITFKLGSIDNPNQWEISTFYEDEQKSTITPSGSIITQISDLFVDLDIHEDDVIIGILVYNGGANGTGIAIPLIQNAMKEIQAVHEHFYFSEINTSK